MNEEQSEQLIEVFKLALKVNAETTYCVFANLHGHVRQFSLDIRRSKNKYIDEIFKKEFYFDIGRADAAILDIKNALNKCLEPGEYHQAFTAKITISSSIITKSFSNKEDRSNWLTEIKKQLRPNIKIELSESRELKSIRF